MPTMGVFRRMLPVEPENTASPKANAPPSEASNQYPSLAAQLAEPAPSALAGAGLPSTANRAAAAAAARSARLTCDPAVSRRPFMPPSAFSRKLGGGHTRLAAVAT